MRADYHVHTAFSDDSDYPMEQVVRDAIALGLEELCFTEHVDYGIKTDWEEPEAMRYRKGGPGEPDEIPLANVDYPAYYETFQKMRSLYGDRIALKLGLTPSRDILGLYQSLGGRILTIGSDSHKPAHLGAYIEETKQELKALGFGEFCTFEKMVPKYHPL